MKTRAKRVLVYAAVCLLLGALVVAVVPPVRARAWGVFTRLRGRQSVESVLASIGPAARARLPGLKTGEVVTLVAFKREKRLEVYAGAGPSRPRLLKSYSILAASGGPGPKTRDGDNQVPEGVYGVASLNPNSAFHLAIRVDYPNADDMAAAKAEGRDPGTLGGDIMIHGKAASIGCLAMGDEAIEELFVLVADAGVERVRILILPQDLRGGAVSDPRAWVVERYRKLAAVLPEP